MWQLYAVGSLLTQAFQGVFDKAALTRDARLDAGVATFCRNAAYLFFVVLIGYLGIFGTVELTFSLPIVAFGALAALSASLYTYALKRVEVTGVYIESYLSPVAFLAIDVFMLQLDLSLWQMVGVVILSSGGFALAFNVHTHRMRREYSKTIWLIFLFWLFYDGAQFYLFKYLHESQGVGEVSFLVSTTLVTAAVLFMVLIVRRKAHLIFHRQALDYTRMSLLGKGMDAISSVLWLYALSLAAVSQVTALNALEPLILLILSYVVQKKTWLNIREHIDRSSVVWKMGATVALCTGTLLVT